MKDAPPVTNTEQSFHMLRISPGHFPGQSVDFTVRCIPLVDPPSSCKGFAVDQLLSLRTLMRVNSMIPIDSSKIPVKPAATAIIPRFGGKVP